MISDKSILSRSNKLADVDPECNFADAPGHKMNRKKNRIMCVS